MDSYKLPIDEVFKKVLAMVEDGINISDALKSLKYNRTLFYQRISSSQKAELQMAKAANAEYFKISLTPISKNNK